MAYIDPFVLVDEGALLAVPDCVNTWRGPAVRNNYKWVSGISGTVAPYRYFLYFYRSDDGGATWAAKDAANAPEVSEYSTCLDLTTEKEWYIAWVFNTANQKLIHLNHFDLDSASYSGDLGTLTLSTNIVAKPTALCLVQRRNRTPIKFLLSYVRYSGLTYYVCFDTWNGTSWDGEVIVATCVTVQFGVEPKIRAAVVDANDRTHLFVDIPNSQTTSELKHLLIQADRSYGSWTTLGNESFLTSYHTAIYKSDTDEVVLSAFVESGVGNTGDACVYRGTPSSAPTFTKETVITGVDYIAGSMLGVNLDEDYSTLYLFSAKNIDTPVDPGYDKDVDLMMSKNSGSGWSTPISVYNTINSPPVLPAGWTIGVENSSVTVFNTSGVVWGGFASGCLLDTPSWSVCNILFYGEVGLGASGLLSTSVGDQLILSDAIALYLYIASLLLGDQLILSDAIATRLSGGDLSIKPFTDGCPEIIMASQYCTSWKPWKTNTLQEVNDCHGEAYSSVPPVKCA